nr:alginate lyase family protein [Kineosporia sp. R_H_3]
MTGGSRAGWYVRRLRRMSPAEVGHRAVDAARRQAWARRRVAPGAVAPPPGALTDRGFGSVLPAAAREQVPADAAAAVVRAADRVLEGRWEALGVLRPDSAAPDWFHDPVTGRTAPQDRLAFRVAHRDETVTGNVKQVWELSRHHQVTTLAAAWWLTGDERYADAAAGQLRSWWQANPFLSGVHWTSGIEIGLRLVAWAWTRRLLDDWPKVGDLFEGDDDALRQIRWHCEYLAAFPSRGSSANNHVVAEAAGLLVGACAFDWFPRSARWRSDAARLLERELAANTFPSGVNRELATDYHRFVLELALVAAVEADAAGRPLSPATWLLVARSLDAAVAVLDSAGRPPRQGDGDEGRALVVDDPEGDPWAAVLGAGAALVGPMPWWPAAPEASVESVVLGAVGRRHPVDGPGERASRRPRSFADAGLTVLRSRPEDGPELWCRCDGGPLGFGSIAAHGHADALSVEVRYDGVELLVDPGTYCYHGEPVLRQWFRSTAAHNTLELGGVDQCDAGGPFLWMTHPRTTTLRQEPGDAPVRLWEAAHDGYTRLPVPLVHRRLVTLDSPARTLTVVDDVTGPVGSSGPAGAAVPLRLSWHLGPAVDVDLGDRTARLAWTAQDGRRTARLRLPGDLTWTAHRGEDDPPLGWYSPRFGRRVPSTSLVGTGSGAAGTHLVTVLELT